MDQRRTMKGLGMTAVMDTRQDRRRNARRRRTVVWIVGPATAALMFDGYDLVVYGTVVSIVLRSPAAIGQVTPAVAGALGSYAILLLGSAGWRGMFWLGALPPLAIVKMRESPAWLAARSRVEQMRAIAERTGVPIPEARPSAPAAHVSASGSRTVRSRASGVLDPAGPAA